MSELTDDEWEELRDLLQRVEACLKTVLGAALCNWSCLMNDFYKAETPDPHLHIHVRPRYDRPVAEERELKERKMENCGWCSLTEEDRRFQVYESRSWSVFLSDEQDYIGRCVLVLKRHCGSMSELTDDEWEELRGLVRRVEACLKTVLGAALCNWSCLMNSFYKAEAPDPHLHIHVRPRYDRPVLLNGNTYSDSEFGHHYAVKKDGRISDRDREAVFARLKEWLDR